MTDPGTAIQTDRSVDRSLDRPLGLSGLAFPVLASLGVVLVLSVWIATIGPYAALRVGQDWPGRQFVEAELGRLPLTLGQGHDGKHAYVAARDPFGLKGLVQQDVLDAYRLRRPLLGWIGGLFGQLPPFATLIGLHVAAIAGYLLTVVSVAALLPVAVMPRGVSFAVLANIGLWSSALLLTPDTLAVGLAVASIALLSRSRLGLAVLLMSLSVLAKEVMLLSAGAVAIWLLRMNRRQAGLKMAVWPLATASAWTAWVAAIGGDALETQGNLSLPFVGIVRAASTFTYAGAIVFGGFAVIAMVLGTLALLSGRGRGSVWVPLTAIWLVVAALSSEVVWNHGNNAARALAPLWLFSVLALLSPLARVSPASGEPTGMG